MFGGFPDDHWMVEYWISRDLMGRWRARFDAVETGYETGPGYVLEASAFGDFHEALEMASTEWEDYVDRLRSSGVVLLDRLADGIENDFVARSIRSVSAGPWGSGV